MHKTGGWSKLSVTRINLVAAVHLLKASNSSITTDSGTGKKAQVKSIIVFPRFNGFASISSLLALHLSMESWKYCHKRAYHLTGWPNQLTTSARNRNCTYVSWWPIGTDILNAGLPLPGCFQPLTYPGSWASDDPCTWVTSVDNLFRKLPWCRSNQH
jgi:hypothetical protein